MFDPQRLLGQVLSGALGGAGRKVAAIDRDLSQMGGLGGFGGGAKVAAGLGLLGVAMAAYEHWRAPSAAPVTAPPASMPPPPPPPGAFPVVSAARPGALPVTRELPAVALVDVPPFTPALHLLRSMIAAAHADGVLDPDERGAILQRAREAQLPAEDLVALGAELGSPRSLGQIVADTPPDLVLETYAAALLAIRVDHTAERQYLDDLAGALQLRPDQREQVHQQVAGM